MNGKHAHSCTKAKKDNYGIKTSRVGQRGRYSTVVKRSFDEFEKFFLFVCWYGESVSWHEQQQVKYIRFHFDFFFIGRLNFDIDLILKLRKTQKITEIFRWYRCSIKTHIQLKSISDLDRLTKVVTWITFVVEVVFRKGTFKMSSLVVNFHPYLLNLPLHLNTFLECHFLKHMIFLSVLRKLALIGLRSVV